MVAAGRGAEGRGGLGEVGVVEFEVFLEVCVAEVALLGVGFWLEVGVWCGREGTDFVVDVYDSVVA